MNCAAYDGLTLLQVFRKVAPEFAAIPEDVVENYLDLAALFVCADEYGKCGNVAIALMAAHIMASPGGVNSSADGSSSSGRVVSRKEGDLSITYGNVSSASSAADYLDGTTYGNLLQLLRKRAGAGFGLMTRGVRGCCGCR